MALKAAFVWAWRMSNFNRQQREVLWRFVDPLAVLELPASIKQTGSRKTLLKANERYESVPCFACLTSASPSWLHSRPASVAAPNGYFSRQSQPRPRKKKLDAGPWLVTHSVGTEQSGATWLSEVLRSSVVLWWNNCRPWRPVFESRDMSASTIDTLESLESLEVEYLRSRIGCGRRRHRWQTQPSCSKSCPFCRTHLGDTEQRLTTDSWTQLNTAEHSWTKWQLGPRGCTQQRFFRTMSGQSCRELTRWNSLELQWQLGLRVKWAAMAAMASVWSTRAFALPPCPCLVYSSLVVFINWNRLQPLTLCSFSS